MDLGHLQEFFRTQEWYDNHALSTILNCRRKAYWHLEFQKPDAETKGLASSVGNGARFGSCIHAGRAGYYGSWGRASEPERRLLSARAFAKEYVAKFGSETPEEKTVSNPQGLDKKHRFDRGLMILDDYYDRFLVEDEKYRPVETELMMILKVEPEKVRPVTYRAPVYLVFRCDGVWERIDTGDLYCDELKTTGSGVQRELTRLGLNRQTTGYTWALRQFSSRVTGVLAQVIGVFVQQFDCGRDYFPKSEANTASWLWQTVSIIDEWRSLRDEFQAHDRALDTYVQNDSQCTTYGMCPYWDLCYYSPAMAEQIPANVWTPANVQEELAL